MEALVTRLNGLCEEEPFFTGWYLKNLRTGEAAERNGHVVVPSASTRKIAIMMAAFAAIHNGRLSLDLPVRITAEYLYSNSGMFQHFTPDFAITLRDAIIAMIVISDNPATGHVADAVGLANVQALCDRIGMTGTTNRCGVPPKDLAWDHPLEANNTTTPADVGLILALIQQGTSDPAIAARLGSTPEFCKLGIQIMLWQKMRDRLPLFLPRSAKVANKTGMGARVNHDAGIIYDGEQPLFILSVFTDKVPGDLPDMSGITRSCLMIGKMARLCYDTLKPL